MVEARRPALWRARVERPARVVAELDVEDVLAQVAHARLQGRGTVQLQRAVDVGAGEAEIRGVADLLEVHAVVLAGKTAAV